MSHTEKPLDFYYLQEGADFYYAPTREEMAALEDFARVAKALGIDHKVNVDGIVMHIPEPPKPGTSPAMLEALDLNPRFSAGILDNKNILGASQKEILTRQPTLEEGVMLHEISHLKNRDTLFRTKLRTLDAYCRALDSMHKSIQRYPSSVLKNIESAGFKSMEEFSERLNQFHETISPALIPILESEFANLVSGEALAEKLSYSPEKREKLLILLNALPDEKTLQADIEVISKWSEHPVINRSTSGTPSERRAADKRERARILREEQTDRGKELQHAVGSVFAVYEKHAEGTTKLAKNYARSAEILCDRYSLLAKDPRSLIKFFERQMQALSPLVEQMTPEEKERLVDQNSGENCHPKDSERIERMEMEIRQCETGKTGYQNLGVFLKDIGVANDPGVHNLAPSVAAIKVPNHSWIKNTLRKIAEVIKVTPIEIDPSDTGIQILTKNLKLQAKRLRE